MKKIQEEKELGEIEDLILDDVECEEITDELKGELEKMQEIICLSLNGCGLKTLKNFPNLPNLIRLEIS